MKNTVRLAMILASCFILGACSTMKSEGPLPTVSYVDIPKFMGKWYVIANIPTFVEKGATNAIETYTWNEKENRIDIDFRYNKNSPQGELKIYPQKGWIYDTKTNAEWRVQPLWPLKFSCLIIDLAPDYSYTAIGVPSRNYVWVMAREKQMAAETFDGIIKKLEKMGYDIKQIQKVPQL